MKTSKTDKGVKNLELFQLTKKEQKALVGGNNANGSHIHDTIMAIIRK